MSFGSSINLSSLNGSNGFRLDGVSATDTSGRSVASAGDVNGDGYADLIIGASGAFGQTGRSYVVFGASAGFAANINLAALNGTNGFRLDGVAGNDASGYSVASAGDVNGDGFGDLIIGAPNADTNGDLSGSSYVVFGASGGFSASVNLAALNGSNGFRLDGVSTLDLVGGSVASAGDLNGDGFADLIIGAQGANGNAGRGYVVFGASGGFASALGLSALNGSNGFRLDGVSAGDQGGWSVASAGDVNGDGLADLIIGANGANGLAGRSYVVFGRSAGFASSLNLSALTGSNGFRLDGASAGDNSGVSVASAGDVNGDGLADLIIGASSANGAAGRAYVVFGRSAGFASILNLSTLTGSNGFAVEGNAGLDQAGFSVASAGDVNGDGFADILLGAFAAFGNGGLSYVVFGRSGGFTASLGVTALTGSNGFRLEGPTPGDQSGWSVAPAGDVDGDGFADLVIGANLADPGGRSNAGASYVFFSPATGGATYRGTSLADVLRGTPDNDVLNGLGQNDRIFGNGGNDTINGGAGNDTMDGGAGIDTLSYSTATLGVTVSLAVATAQVTGGAGTDIANNFENLTGGAGNDSLTGSALANAISGGGGDDTVDGAAGNDTLDGGTGIDTLSYAAATANVTVSLALTTAQVTGGSGTDTVTGFENLTGGSGNDSLTGSVAANVIEGGAGNDTLDGGLGNDTLSYASATGNVTVSLALTTPQNTGGAGIDTVLNFESLLGGAGNDSLTGDAGDNAIDGGAGNDTIDGGAGDDGMLGGAGIDTLSYATIDADVTFSLNSLVRQATGGAGNDTASGFENLVGGGGNDRLTGSTLANRIDGGAGDDTIDGGSGNDTLDGGPGIDTLSYASATGNVTVNLALSTAQQVGNFTSHIIANVENLTGGAGNDSLTGSAGDNVIDGGNGHDTIGAGAGDDNVNGGAGNDLINGGAGRDTIGGGSGNDLIDGGAGNDSIDGGPGDDVIRWSAGGGNDVVTLGSGANQLQLPGYGTGWSFVDNGATRVFTNAMTAETVTVTDWTTGNNSAGDYLNLGGIGGTSGFRLDGASAGDQSGTSVAWAGDVNGDGFADVIIGAGGADPNGSGSGSSYVVFGGTGVVPSGLSLSLLNGANGFRLDGVCAADNSGAAVASAGDVNGDGFADIIIGAPQARGFAGASYVVFGAADGFAASMNLAALDGSNGFRLDGVASGNLSGSAVASAGDVNGDGFADIIIGARGAGAPGASYLVFGAAGGFASSLSLSALNGGNGFRLDGGLNGESSGRSVASAGDVNGDGFADLIIGADGASQETGRSYVVFGASGGFGPSLNLGGLNGGDGFRLNGASTSDLSGVAVASAGDVNGDGFGDILVGASMRDNSAGSGASYVVFGAAGGFASSVFLTGLNGSNGFRLNGASAGDLTGASLGPAGDLNGDGFADIIIGAGIASRNGLRSGSSYVIYGASGGFDASQNLSALPAGRGFRLDGASADDRSGSAVAGAGDVDGDGFADLIIGAPVTDVSATDAGSSYILFSTATGSALYRGTSLADILRGTPVNDVMNGNGQNDRLFGNAGRDTIDGGTGDDTVDGGADDDMLDGGLGIDTLSYASAMAGVTVRLALTTAQVTGGAGTDTAVNFENLAGGAGNDSLAGSDGDNVIGGGAGNDTMDGGAGIDTLSYAAASAGVTVSLALSGPQTTGGAGDDTAVNFENLTGGRGHDALTGSDGDNIITGGAGNDTIDGGAGNDTAQFSGSQASYRFGSRDAVVMVSGVDGQDTLINVEAARWGNAAAVSIASLIASADNTGLVYAKLGPAPAGYILPGAYAGPVAGLVNQFLGSAGSDVVLGTGRADFINAGPGDDAVDGGAGNDVIDGGFGSNFLTGGVGLDQFFIEGRAAASSITWSTITDFAAGETVTIWGYKPGVSVFLWVENDGVAGYLGATLHGDLDGNGVIDTSVTWTGLTQAQLPAPLYGTDYIYFA